MLIDDLYSIYKARTKERNYAMSQTIQVDRYQLKENEIRNNRNRLQRW
jgi:hypothetical protein